jgi:hypothetical protein
VAAAIAVGGPAAAAAKPAPASPCRKPDAGYLSCLRVLYEPVTGGTVDNVSATATLLLRVDRCPARVERRKLTLTRSVDDVLVAVRRPGRCRDGLIRWEATYDPGETKDWQLMSGDTVDTSWSGTRAASSVALKGTEG